MTLKFSDIMKNFYNDETLGIKNEDAPECNWYTCCWNR